VRLCRFRKENNVEVGVYDERLILPLRQGADVYESVTATPLGLPESDELLDYLPPDGIGYVAARTLADWFADSKHSAAYEIAVETTSVELLVPIARPNKLLLLAGNYAKHIEEQGRVVRDRKETFPYVFMKPPSTTLADPGKPVRLPAVAPEGVDWELELAVVIGRRTKGVTEEQALGAVAGYTIVNDISHRRFKPNPNRKPRDRDEFFDWMHGKWMDSFCPCGPCIATPDLVGEPQSLRLTLKLNGEVRQDGSTSQQIFRVAEVIAFISSFVTLEPGDIISTGTPAGVGNPTGQFLKAGDLLEGRIERIGALVTPVVNDE
jgi:2-keto-4-pentenoate hydratase/2-oxohepta-3-ene-1,7-dioic acid hydratase in catechol pathway